MSERRHILICGEVGVGKTTLIRRLLAHSRRPLYGFATRRVPERDGTHAVYIHPAAQSVDEHICSSDNLAGICGREETFCARTFDTLGVRLLRAPAEGVILMDELGFMESGAERFCAAVLAALDGDTPVLAAVKHRDTPFLQQVRKHGRGELFFITPENRDGLFQQILPKILAWDANR